jgi:hypothetical protein
LEALTHERTVLTRVEEMSPWTKVVADLTERLQEVLGVLGRLEPLQAALPSSGRLVRVLGPVIQPLVLPVFDVRQEFPQRRALTA